MSSTISWHIEKHVSGDVGGLQIHNQRLTDHHSNKRIDISKSHENLHAQSIREKFGETSYSERINQEIENRYLGKRKIRSNAIVDVQHTIQFGGDQFEKLSRDQKNQLMMSATKFVAEKFGGWQNVLDWNAHLDETNDHAHMDMIPLTEDGRLSAKDLYSKGTLQIVQNELLTHMQELYPEMDFKRADKTERGFANGKTQKDYERLKALSDANKDDLKQVEALKHDMTESIRDIDLDFKVQDDDYDQAFSQKGEMSDDVFYAKYGYQPEPVKSAIGFDQVKDFLSLKRLKSVFLDAWRHFKNKLDDFYQNKEKEITKRENDVESKIKKLSGLSDKQINHTVDLIEAYYGNIDKFIKINPSFDVPWNDLLFDNWDIDKKKLVGKFVRQVNLTPEQVTSLNIKREINSKLADTVIALGGGKNISKENMILIGISGMADRNGKTLKLAETIPLMILDATEQKLNQVHRKTQEWELSNDEPHHGRSL